MAEKPVAKAGDYQAYEEFMRALGHDPDRVTKVVIENGGIIVDTVTVHPLDWSAT